MPARKRVLIDATEINTYSDDPGARMHAFLASVRPVADGIVDEAFEAGRLAVFQMAEASRGREDNVTIPLSKCADVLSFLACIHPVNPRDWWNDPNNAPSHVCGLALVFNCLEESLRGRGDPTNEA